MTRLRFLLTGILASLAACLPWGTRKLTRQDFKVTIVPVQDYDNRLLARWQGIITDTRNQVQLGLRTKAFDTRDVDDMTACRMEIDDMVRIVIERRLQALA